VVGKAVMLDEIINYVQSLQRQVEVYAHSHPTHMQLQNHHETASFAVLERPEEDHLKRLPLMYIFLQFLSMKLATVNPQLDFNNLPNLLAKYVRTKHI
jgi:hypothetical protein